MNNVRESCKLAQNAAFSLSAVDSKTKNDMLECIAQALLLNKEKILKANLVDLDNAKELSLSMQDRLKLTPERIDAMAEGVKQIIKLKDPIGEVTKEWTIENGLHFNKVRVPLGVIAVIYEARPNVTIDVAALCLKSGNAVILRGGKEAINSNRALYEVIKTALEDNNFDPNVVVFIDDTSRESSKELLMQGDLVDVVIPRGGNGLKHFVLENATMPVIASAGGNCHTYVHESADIELAKNVIYNAKMSRPSTCNALEQILIDRKIAKTALPTILENLIKDGCRVTGSKEVCDIISQAVLAKEEDYKKEHLDYELTVYIVDDYLEAIDRINHNNTKHSEAIIAKDEKVISFFEKKVDAGCVYVNTSTRFTDGFQFGFGAEIGISTQKLHARGPLGLEQLTSEKYIVVGNGQIRK